LSYTLRIAFTYLALLALVASTAMLLRRVFEVKNNLFLYHIFTPVEYLLFCLIYYRAFESSVLRKSVLWSIIGFVVVCIYLSLFVEPLEINNSYAKVIESLLITVWVLLYFRQLVSADKIINFNKEPLVWISLGLLTYFIGNLFTEGMFNLLVKEYAPLAQRLYSYTYLFEYNLFLQMNIALFCRQIFKENAKT
ncbi:MAG TPA: hypothetical protein VEY06_04720, partial [Flavisolibacter sp.]|nr:hypothetical protein [Flavisolibacter sp.]